MPGNIALYIHVPFCLRKCRYCSFVSYAGRERQIHLYVESVIRELEKRSRSERICSLYLGGGTPSLLPAGDIGKLLAAVDNLFSLDKAAEITIEANPGTLNERYLREIRQIGVNRLSLGIQSFKDNELKILGRIHTAEEAAAAVHSARNAGFDNLNLDLIYGLPGQTETDWRYTLGKAISLAPEHFSLYALTLECNAPLQLMINAGSLPAIDADLSAGLYELAEDFLSAYGYRHYEISNWAKPGRQCRHNLVYWKNLPYLGVGVAAHSFIGGHRLANTANLDTYLNKFSAGKTLTPEFDEAIGSELALAETVILGLRLGEGINAGDIMYRFHVDIRDRYRRQIDEMVVAGLLEQADGHLCLTPRGRLLSNEVFWRFLPD